jgi:thermitase
MPYSQDLKGERKMKLKMAAGVMVILMLMSMLTIAFNVPQILADAGTTEHPNYNPTIQKTDGDKPSNLTDSHESFATEGLNRNASAKENLKLYSVDEDRWNFNSTNEWTDFAKVDCDSAELIVGVNSGNPNNYANIIGLIDESGGDSAGTVSMDGKIRAVVADIPLGAISSFVTEVRDADLSTYIEPNMKFQACFVPDDPYWSYQWGPRIIEADYAWNTTLGDTSVLVAVIDTGIDWNHPDLAANYVALGYDWVNDDTDPMDDEGHGTHCAGIIAAVINNGIGVAGLAQVKIMAEKGLDSWGYGYEDDLANAIIHAVDQGADILSNSWGSYGESALIYEAVEYAYDHGVLVAAAAGNDAASTEFFPAAFDEVIAVTATDEYDNPAWFLGWWGTNFGDWVELAAPGVDIYSTVWDDSYAYMSGTSMAAPHVVGVAALILSQFPSMTRDQVRLQLRFTADDLGDSGFDDYYGYGRINARRAVEQGPPDHDLLILDWERPRFVEPGGLAVVNTTVFNFGTSNETDITVQLLVNGSIVDSATIGFLETAASETVNCSWTPAVEGTYNLTSYVVPVQNETLTANNFVTAMVDVGYFNYILFDQTHWTDSIVMYSTWVNTLSERGYVVDVHTSGPITPTVLADYVALVIPQAWDPYSLEELSAIQSFVVAGGGLLVIGDDEPSVYTDLTAFAGISWVSGGYSGITTDVTPHEVTLGVTSVYLDAPIAEMVVGGCAQDLVRDPWGGIMLAVSEQPGRVIGFADEGSLWDYGITQEDNLLLANNMVDWLVFQPEHDLAVILGTPPYVAPGGSSLLNVTVRNRGLSNETDVELFLFINGTIVKNETAPEIVSDSSYTMDYLWTPAGENVMYNVTGYAVPVENETATMNNLEWAYVYIGVPVKAFVLDSAGTDNSGIISTWQLLTTSWYVFGEKMTFIDYTTLNNEDLTYEDLAATDADVLIISCASDPYQGWEFTDSEIEAIGRYVQEGHGLIATSGTFYGMVPNNNKLAPLFGLTETITWHQSYTDLLHIEDPTHPLFDNVPNPYTFPGTYSAFPSDGQWDSNELAGGEYVALGHFQESAIVVCRGLVYISPLLEYGIPPYYHHHLQLLYNAITWSSYQKPEHELVVSLDAPAFIEPGDSSLLNATVHNRGLSNETNVELFLLINGTIVNSTIISKLLTGASYTISYWWTPTIEGTYNATAFAPPVSGEEFTANNQKSKFVEVFEMLIAVVLDSYGTDQFWDTFWNYLNTNWATYGSTRILIDYTALNKENITLADIEATNADVLIISDAWSDTHAYGWEFSDSEIEAIKTYVLSGHGIIATSGTFDTWSAPNNQKLAELFGMDPTVWYNWGFNGDQKETTGIFDLQVPRHDELWRNIADPYLSGSLITLNPTPSLDWTMQGVTTGWIEALSTDHYAAVITSATIIHKAVYFTCMVESMGQYNENNRQLFYNAIVWTQLPPHEHELAVSLEAPSFLEPGASSLLNATVYNIGLSNETDVELFLLINGTAVNSTAIPELLTGQSYTINYLWTPAVEATYNVTAYAPPVPGENVTVNNVVSKIIHVRYVYVALISDYAELLAITPILDSLGIGYDIYNDNRLHLYTEHLNLLLSYPTVIFYTDYRQITLDEYSALESYLSSGGNLLVTGFDSLVSDDLLRDLIRSATMGDNTGEPDLYVVDATHPITNGPYGSFPSGYHISGLYSDCDAVEADIAQNAITVAMLWDGYDKIIATDGLLGKVVYWNGRGDYDWVNNVDCETMLGNILAWFALPIIPRDVAIISVTSSATEVYEGQIVNITIVAKNEGNITETFDVAAYYGASVIGTQNVANLTAGANVTLTFNWDTSSAKPSLISYMIKAIAASVPGEIDTADNTYFDGYVKVKMVGDVNGDGIIDIVDVVIAAIIFGSAAEDDPETPWDETRNWNPVMDLNEDGIIDIVDLVIIGVNFGKRLPEGFERTTVYVDPQATTVMVGETFTVSVKIFNVTNLFGFEYKLFWNSTYLNLTSYTFHVPAGWEPPNGFLVKDEIGVWMGGNKTGLAYHWYAYTSITGAPFTGDLTLATYTFEALNPGICTLDIHGDRFVDNTATYIPHDTVDGYVTIV